MSTPARNANLDDPDTDDENDVVDPELRLRTVRTAHSTLEESMRTEDRLQRRKTQRRKRSLRFFRREKKRPGKDGSGAALATPAAAVPAGLRRSIYVNLPLPSNELDKYGEPVVRYCRNKVRTSKYTIITFIPKNIWEQFRRVANLFFLVMVIVQFFAIFGAPSPQTSALPLLFIIFVTAIKDAIEDYRRALLDEQVNNSAATKLGQWKNVNQPTDPRGWWEKLLGINPPGKVTRGVRRLREREAEEGKLKLVLTKTADADAPEPQDGETPPELGYHSGNGGSPLDVIQSIDSHSYPPQSSTPPISDNSIASKHQSWREVPEALKSYEQSIRPRKSDGVLDYGKRITGMSRWERTLWKKLEVGDIVLLRDNEQVPADIMVISTSDPDNMCYLETKNLDGETNLKPRKAVRATGAAVSEEDIERMAFVLDSEPPHQNLYLYHGVLRYNDPITGESKQEAVSINELLLRGCSVRNTAWIIGMVVFTGADSKIMLNGGETPSKQSKIEKETNFNVIVNFAFLIAMCAIAGIGSGVWDSMSDTSAKEFEKGVDASSSYVVNALVTFTSCLIAFQNIVPISLYISIEIVKTIQAFFISQDVDMYYEPFDAACAPKTWNICDDLGQIEYIFSDKTGTLTQNIMEFQKCSVNGVSYGEGVTEAQRGAAKREGKADAIEPEDQDRQLRALKAQMLATMSRAFKNRYIQKEKLTLISPKLAEDLANRSSPQRQALIEFFRALAICHSVLSDRPEPNKEPYHLEYKAESPDESALVAAARDVGFPFVGKTRKNGIEIEVMGQSERYIPLQMLEFNSTRKRMSVVVRNPQGQIILYCKGADSVIYQRLAADHDPVSKENTAKDMEAFANGGLRTLCIAYRYLTEQEYIDWSREYEAATSAVEDRDEAIDKASEKIEHSLTILGATALEDKLQEGVPEAIETLHKAGIKLWILTGDKVQTAIEIGFSCNLLKSDMEIMILSADNLAEAQLQIEGGLNKMASVLGPYRWEKQQRGFIPGAQQAFAVVIDGDTLRHALTDELKPLFLNLATQCETVVCCRVSPAQKALVVKLVKEGRNAMTLSIGDGANDVAMIQEANVGCGLLGYEGSQAAMSADYAFGQFRFLTKLLIVHGRWSYQRIADMHSNFFYKNMIWTFAMFWFLIYNSFDATYLYQYTFVLLYNLVFTSLPVIMLGAFDQDINAKAALAFPQLYIRGIRGLEYTRLKFWLYMFDGLYQSVVVFFIPYFVWTLGPAVSWDGRAVDSLSDFGTTVSVAAIWAANTYVGINTHYWTVITWVIILGSSIVMFAWIVIYSFFPSPDFMNEVIDLCGQSIFWFTIIIAVIIALAPRFVVKFISTSFFPQDRDIIRELWVHGNLKDQLGIKHRQEMQNISQNELEQAPMFHRPHFRSESEASSSFHPDPYVGSPGSRSPHGSESPAIQSEPSSPSPLRQAPFESEDYLTVSRTQMTPSPYRGSYYSASNIPAPSPPPGLHDPPMSAVSSNPVVPYPPPSSTLQVPIFRNHPPNPTPEMYEMDVRSPSAEPPISPGYGMHPASAGTDTTFNTAYDDPYGGIAPQDGGGHLTAEHPPSQDWRESTYSTYSTASGPTVL